MPPLLAELTHQGILSVSGFTLVRWVHDKFKEATRTTIPSGSARRKKHQAMGLFLETRPAFLFDGQSDHQLANT